MGAAKFRPVSGLRFRLAVQSEVDGDGGRDIYRQSADPIGSVATLEDGLGSCVAKDGLSFDHVHSSDRARLRDKRLGYDSALEPFGSCSFGVDGNARGDEISFHLGR